MTFSPCLLLACDYYLIGLVAQALVSALDRLASLGSPLSDLV